jgi:hypothetical protein
MRAFGGSAGFGILFAGTGTTESLGIRIFLRHINDPAGGPGYGILIDIARLALLFGILDRFLFGFLPVFTDRFYGHSFS